MTNPDTKAVVERLTEERLAFLIYRHADADAARSDRVASIIWPEVEAQLTALRAELEAAREALRPFARYASQLSASARDHDMARDYPATPLVGDLRRAAAILKGSE